MKAKDLLRYYEEGIITYSELVCSLSELPEEEIGTLPKSLKAQALKVKRMVAAGGKIIRCGVGRYHG